MGEGGGGGEREREQVTSPSRYTLRRGVCSAAGNVERSSASAATASAVPRTWGARDRVKNK